MSNLEGKRALIAARLSRKQAGGDEGIGLDTQDQRSREFCQVEAMPVVGIARDTISGSKAPIDRKNLGKWISKPELRDSYDVIVAFKTDRLSRGIDTDWSRIETWAADHGKILVIVGPDGGIQYPSRNDSDFWQWSATKRQAGSELESIRERIGRAHVAIHGNGGLVGRSGFGHDIVGPKYSKSLAINETEAQIARDAADYYLSGPSLQDTCNMLNNQGRLTRSGSEWSPKTLSQVLRSENMIGRHYFAGTLLKCEPILTRTTWIKVVARLDERANRAGISQADEPALLTSFIFCAVCWKGMYRINSRGTLYYYCRRGCKSMVLVELADRLAELYLLQRYGSNLRTITRTIPGEGYDDQIADVKQDIRELDVEADDYDARLTELRAKLAWYKSLPATAPQIVTEETGETVEAYWVGQDPAGRRELLRGVLNAYYAPGWDAPQFTSAGLTPAEVVKQLSS